MLKRPFAASLVLVAALAPAAPASAAAPTIADCTAATTQTVIEAQVSTTVIAARAIWFSETTLRWPGKAAHARYRLHHSARGRLAYRIGARVAGADGVLVLDAVAAPLPNALSSRFKYVADGVTLRVRKADIAQLATVHRGQMLLVQEDADGRVLDATRLQAAVALDDLFADAGAARDLGVTITHAQTGFGLWAPTARHVALCVYMPGDSAATTLHSMRRDRASGIWNARLDGDSSGALYAYLVDVHVPGIGIVRNRVTDPYSISLDTDSRHSYVGALASAALKPPGWDADRPPSRIAAATDMVIYELHVRDFSVNDASVPSAHRGKYLAFTAADSNGMRHLRALSRAGVTDLHLLPVFDIASIPESACVTPSISGTADGETQQAAVAAVHDRDCYNWGYDPWHYTAPEGSYATSAVDPALRVRELRSMVMGLHAIGLRVGMDVVYNHTSASGQAATSVLDRIVPGYYQRLDAEGVVERSTCCDNTATEHRMMARLMIDSVSTWARDHHIDSFRFDLMGHQPRAVMQALQVAVDRAAGRHIDLIGEGWNFGEVADGARFVQASQGSLDGSGIATFSDRARDAVRGGGCCDSGEAIVTRQGFINGQYYDPNALSAGKATRADLLRSADLVRVGLAGSLREFELPTAQDQRVPMQRIDYEGKSAGYASTPGEVVNYVENHDNPTLFDINALKLPVATSTEDRARVQILAAAVTAFSQGIAYFHAGLDTLRSKSLDRNSFDSGDAFNRLDWTYTDNSFGSGLPPRSDNGVNWPWLQPVLANAAIKPTPTDIAWTRDAFRDLLRLRASTSLFRLRSAAGVRERLRFYNTGSQQEPTVVVARIDGRDVPGAVFRELIYFINVDTQAHALVIDEERGKPWQLHPLQRAEAAADDRPRLQAEVDVASGRFSIPPRTAVVYVVEQSSANGK